MGSDVEGGDHIAIDIFFRTLRLPCTGSSRLIWRKITEGEIRIAMTVCGKGLMEWETIPVVLAGEKTERLQYLRIRVSLDTLIVANPGVRRRVRCLICHVFSFVLLLARRRALGLR